MWRPERPARCLVMQGFQSGETSSIPGTCVPHATEHFSAQEWLSPSEGSPYQSGTAGEELVSMTDEKPALASAGLMGQVASRRSSPPPLAMKSPRDLDGSRAVYPISRTSIDRWAAGSFPTLIKEPCQGACSCSRHRSVMHSRCRPAWVHRRGMTLLFLSCLTRDQA